MPPTINSDLKFLEFLATKSHDLLEKQVNAYRQKQSNAGTIIGVIALFIPFFLNGLDDSYSVVKYLSIIPVGLLISAVALMLGILRTKPVYQSFAVHKFQELVNKPYQDILLYEIGANNDSFRDNKSTVENANKNYDRGVKFTIVAIFISTFLLLTNQFCKPEKSIEPIKVQLINSDP